MHAHISLHSFQLIPYATFLVTPSLLASNVSRNIVIWFQYYASIILIPRRWFWWKKQNQPKLIDIIVKNSQWSQTIIILRMCAESSPLFQFLSSEVLFHKFVQHSRNQELSWFNNNFNFNNNFHFNNHFHFNNNFHFSNNFHFKNNFHFNNSSHHKRRKDCNSARNGSGFIFAIADKYFSYILLNVSASLFAFVGAAANISCR